MQLVIFELTLHDFTVLLGNSTKARQLAFVKVSFNNAAIMLDHLALAMHDILIEDAFANGSIRSNDLGHTVQIMVLKLSYGTMTLVNVSTETIDAVQAVCSHLQLALIEELLLSLAIVVNDADATDLSLFFVVSSILNFDEFFYASDTEVASQLEGVGVDQLLEVETLR